MFYNYFKKVFLNFRNTFYNHDKPRIDAQIYPKEVQISSFSYGSDPIQKINLYRMNETDKPLIIDIHGGAWVYGDVDLNNQFCNYMCLKGFDVVSIGYRLIDDVLLKDIFDDIFLALKFIKTLGLTEKKIYLTGDSAGGHLALVVSKLLKDKVLAKHLNFDVPNIDISSLCINHPVPYTDIAGRVENHKILTKLVAKPGLNRILYGKNYKNSSLFKYLKNPTVYINKEGDIPPLFLITSTADKTYYYQSKMLHDYLDSINYEHEYYCEQDETATHVFNLLVPEAELSNKVNNMIANFFKKH